MKTSLFFRVSTNTGHGVRLLGMLGPSDFSAHLDSFCPSKLFSHVTLLTGLSTPYTEREGSPFSLADLVPLPGAMSFTTF